MSSSNRLTANTVSKMWKKCDFAQYNRIHWREKGRKCLYKEPLDQLLESLPTEHKAGATPFSIPVF
jgi:hypothetical protein